MSELQDRLKKMALEIYAESDECESKQDAQNCRRNLLNKINIKERWMVKEYVARIGKERQRRVCRENYRNDLATAIEKGVL